MCSLFGPSYRLKHLVFLSFRTTLDAVLYTISPFVCLYFCSTRRVSLSSLGADVSVLHSIDAD